MFSIPVFTLCRHRGLGLLPAWWGRAPMPALPLDGVEKLVIRLLGLLALALRRESVGQALHLPAQATDSQHSEEYQEFHRLSSSRQGGQGVSPALG
jgi:hypothetical protein